ncbi:MAG TPA: DNA-binding protein [Chthoniobacterales bacterium]
MSQSEWPVRNDYRNGRTEHRVPDAPIATEKVIIDRKIFFLDLKENARGRFMKITEDVNGRRDTIMLPAQAFEDFAAALTRLVEYERSLT